MQGLYLRLGRPTDPALNAAPMPSLQADGPTGSTPAFRSEGVLATSGNFDGLSRRRLWRTFRRNRPAVVGLVLVVAITCLSLLAPFLAAHDPVEQKARARLKSPDSTHLLDRDGFGRDVLARVLHVGRISLLVGLCSVVVGAALGSGLGLVAGYGGPATENVLMRLVDILMAFPNLLLGLTIPAVLGPGLLKITIAIGLILPPAFAPVVHASALSLKTREFVEAARALGVPQPRVLGFHVLPNVAGEVVVLASLWTASAIRVEASLSFIGLGVSPPTPTWGNMMREGTLHLTNAPWLSVVPGIAILVTVMGFNLGGRPLRRPRPATQGLTAEPMSGPSHLTRRHHMHLGHEQFMRLALGKAAKAGAEGNVAVGAQVVRGDEVIGRGRNLVVSAVDPTAHAEIVAIRDAATTLRQVDLSGSTLYTTWEPCPMCLAGTLVAGVGTLVMGTRYSLRRWGGCNVEIFLDLVHGRDRLQVLNDVPADEELNIHWQWGGPPAGSRSNTPPASRRAH